MNTLQYETARMLRWARDQADPIAALKERLASDEHELAHSQYRRDYLFLRDSRNEIAGIKAALITLGADDVIQT